MISLTETDLRSGRREIRVQGELDLAVAPMLVEAIERAAEYDQVVISLEECEFIDSTGIAVIVRAHQDRKSGGRRLVVCARDGQVRLVLDLIGLSEYGLVF